MRLICGVKSMDDQALQQAILQQLQQVIDPELNIDIVSLGLVYAVDVDVAGNCQVQMTLTTMGCPLTVTLEQLVKEHLLTIPPLKQVKVVFVFDPPWSPAKMSRAARLQLGI